MVLPFVESIVVWPNTPCANPQTHPTLPDVWYRTPFDFLSRENFVFDRHYYFMQSLPLQWRMPLLSRKIPKLWDRFPCASMDPPDSIHLVLMGWVVLTFYACSFCLAWNFFFPTRTEQLLWRICSVYHGCFTASAGIHYTVSTWQFLNRTKSGQLTSSAPSNQPMLEIEQDAEAQSLRGKGWAQSRRSLGQLRLVRWLESLRNLSPDQDPDVESSLRGILAWSATGMLFAFCRAYLYTEDFISLRSQPAGIYVTVNSYLPFLGG